MIVERVRFHQVDDVEFVLLASLGIGYSEVVPLGVSAGVVVWLQNKVVLVLVDLDGSSQVTTLKPTFEQQSIVILTLWHVKRRNLAFRRRALPCIRAYIDRVKHHPVHKTLLVGDTLGLAAQTFFQDKFLRRVERLKLSCIFGMYGRVLH